MKKFISILLVFAALMGVSSVALAASFSRVDGTVTAVADDKSYIEAKLASGAQFIFRVDANSVFLSGTTGEAIAIQSVKAGDKFTAWHGEATTASLPAQSYLHTMIVTAAESESYAHFITVKSVRYDGDNVVLTNDAGDLLVTVQGATSVKQFAATGYTNSAAKNIYPKAQIIAWYETVLESMPAQTTATRVVVLYDGKAAAPTASPVPTATPAPTVKPAPTATPAPGVTPPQTGDGMSASVIGFIALGLAAMGTVSVIVTLKKKER